MKTLALVILAILARLPLSLGQDETKPESVDTAYIHGDEARRLIKALSASPETRISFDNVDRSPLVIVSASVSSVGRHQPGEPSSTTAAREYVVSERITVVNTTGRHIRGAAFIFTDADSQGRFNVSRRIAIEPHGSAIFGEPRNDAPVLLSIPMKPGRLSVRVLEVIFADGTIWGEDSRDVDEAPVPVYMPAQPPHTKEALNNRIQGTLRMRLLVGEDGVVKQVKVIRGLPDGLNEQAVQQAYSLIFKPATRDGKTVECWLLFELEYNLVLFRRSSPRAKKPRPHNQYNPPFAAGLTMPRSCNRRSLQTLLRGQL